MGFKTEQNKWTNNKNKQVKSHRHRQQYGGYEREEGWGADSEGKGGQIYGDGRRFDFVVST